MVINSRNVWSQMNSNYVVTAAVSCDDLPFFAFALNFSSLKKLNDVIGSFNRNLARNRLWQMFVEEFDYSLHRDFFCETDKRGPMPFGFGRGRGRGLEFRETGSLRDDDRAFQGPGPFGPRRNWWRGWIAWDPGVALAQGSFEPQGASPLSRLLPGADPQTRQTCVTQKVTLLLKAGHGLSRRAVV